MGRNEPADLEHDLGMSRKWDRPRIAAPANAADEGEHPLPTGAPEARKTVATQRLSPDREQLADREVGSLYDLDDSGRLARPRWIGAATRDDVDTCRATRRSHPNARRDDDDAPLRKDLQMRAKARLGSR